MASKDSNFDRDADGVPIELTAPLANSATQTDAGGGWTEITDPANGEAWHTAAAVHINSTHAAEVAYAFSSAGLRAGENYPLARAVTYPFRAPRPGEKIYARATNSGETATVTVAGLRL